MAVVQIHPAEREGSRLVFAFAGWTGKGKTYTAIQFAYGLAGYDAKKVGFMDAENKRGSLCADILEHATRPTKDRFLIGDLYAPFSPARYAMGIDDFQAAGCEVLIIDSVTHEWEGIGGCQDIAEEGNPKMPRWDYAKREHKKFMNKLLQSDMHIICCVRAREKSRPEKKGGKLEYVNEGLQPIQEKNFMFEVTASLMMFDEGRRQETIKVPAALLAYLGRKEGYITADDGYAVRQWVNGALKLDPVVEKWRSRLQANTEGGLKHIEECWTQTPPQIKEALGKVFHETLIEAAKGYEEQARIRATEGDPEQIASGSVEQAEANAIADKARTAAAAAPAATATTPAATSTTPAAQPAEQTKPATEQQAKPAEQPKTATAATQAPKKESAPVQQELAAPVKGVLPSDPMF